MTKCGVSRGTCVTAFFLTMICCLSHFSEAQRDYSEPIAKVKPHNFTAHKHDHEGRELKLVEPPPLILTYHNGPLLTQGPSIPIYIIWFGRFSSTQQAIIRDLFASFGSKQSTTAPSVGSWWKLTAGYKNAKGAHVAPHLSVEGEITIAPTGYTLAESALESLLVVSLKKFPAISNAVYVIFTSADIQLDNFCMDTCASHFASDPARTKGKSLPYVWVGNPANQCPGLCAWPYAKPAYGPPEFVPLLPPNKDVGIDGLIINLASMLAGVATNPFDTGYYQGDASAPLESATACTGIYGAGAYPGYPGQLLIDNRTKASYNAKGAHMREFLLPALWNPNTLLCTPP